MTKPTEIELIRERYARRAASQAAGRYDLIDPAVLLSVQERERALLQWIRHAGIAPPATRRLLEIGCGSGRNLLELLRFGFRPENLAGNDLLPERVEAARHVLPSDVRIVAGDAAQLEFPDESFDIVYQSVVFTSILDRDFQQKLARRMWNWVAPGGGILWYDFVYDNPRNRDVAGVPLRRIRELFPEGEQMYWRLTLAPPVGRIAARIHPALYGAINTIPLLRTHVLCWIRKASTSS